MALFNDMPTWKVALLSTGLGIYDGYCWTRRKANRAYDFLEDRVDETSYLLSQAANDVLYQTGLSLTSHIPRTFPQFDALPTEIRVLIWHHARPEPRVVELRTNFSVGKKTLQVKPAFEGITSTCRIPPVLHVCQESRVAALRSYQLALGTHITPPKVYVDFSRDTIYCDTRSNFFAIQSRDPSARAVSFLASLRVPDMAQIRSLALRVHHQTELLMFSLDVFCSLNIVVLVGNRKFELGLKPKLEIKAERFVEREGMASEAMPILERHLSHLHVKCKRWKEEHPEWWQPDLYGGVFVKMKGDRWYCNEPSRWSF